MSVWRRALLRAANAGRAALEVRDVPAAAFHHHRACACACALSPILRDHPWPSRWAGSSAAGAGAARRWRHDEQANFSLIEASSNSPSLYIAAASLEDVRGELERMNELFAVARDEIELAMEDKDTVYFEEGYREAKRCTEEVIRCWEGVLAR